MKKNFGPKAWLYPMPALIIGSYEFFLGSVPTTLFLGSVPTTLPV